MNNRRGKKLLHIVLSLLIALAIWVYVDNQEGIQVNKSVNDIPIEFIGEDTTLADRGLMLLSDSDSAISLKISGPRDVIARLDTGKIRIQADLSNITATGEQNINYRIIWPSPSNEFSSSLTIKSASSYYVAVDIGELYSKDVEIRCDIRGSVAPGYIAGQIQFLPATLQVRGQQEEVDKIAYAKVALDIGNATETVTKMLNYQLYDEGGNAVDAAELHAVTDQIQVTLPVNVVKELPLTMKFIESPGASLDNVDYSIEPKTISVSGDAAKLKDITSIVLDDFSLADLTGAVTYNYSIPIPDGCENLSGVSRATLKIAFRDMASRDFITTNITCSNQPEGKTVAVLTEELAVTLRGTTPDLDAVLPGDVSAIADLTDVSSANGSYTVPVDIRVNTGGNLGIVGEYQIKITISDE